MTSHASIVRREMGIPCIVGTEKATKILHDGDLITVDGTSGIVYKGQNNINIQQNSIVQTQAQNSSSLNDDVSDNNLVTGTTIYMNFGDPDKIDDYGKLPFDGIGLMRIEFIII